MKAQAFVCSTLCALVLIACSSSDDSDASRDMCGPFTAELRIEDKFGEESTTFTAGEPIDLTMRITNNGDAEATLSYDGCPAVRFVVFDANHQSVFDSLPPDTNCTQQVRLVSYASKETQEFALEWTQTYSGDGGQVPPGRYTAEAGDRSAECADTLSQSLDFTIQ